MADAAVALGTTEKKMEEGKDLIRYFSVPCKPSKTNGGRTRNLPTDAPEKWAVYRQYNAQDVETERAIRKALEKYPVLRWNFDNAYVRTDPAGNLKLDKEKSTEKIDGAVALVMALDRAMKNQNGGDSVYDDRGLLLL